MKKSLNPTNDDNHRDIKTYLTWKNSNIIYVFLQISTVFFHCPETFNLNPNPGFRFQAGFRVKFQIRAGYRVQN